LNLTLHLIVLELMYRFTPHRLRLKLL